MSRQPDIEKTLDQGVQIPRTSSTNWDIPVNDNWELLNNTIKRNQGHLAQTGISLLMITGNS